MNALPMKTAGHVTFGCLNNFCKISDGTLDLWGRVMANVPGSRLLLLSPPGKHRHRVTDLIGRHGIASERMEFVEFRPHNKYLALYNRIDVGLDTFPYNGHTTSLDSFWMGVPVVTKIGRTAVGRAGWCQLSNLGLPELCAASDEDFIRLAVDLAGDLPRLSALRAGLRDRLMRSPLCDGPRFAQEHRGSLPPRVAAVVRKTIRFVDCGLNWYLVTSDLIFVRHHHIYQHRRGVDEGENRCFAQQSAECVGTGGHRKIDPDQRFGPQRQVLFRLLRRRRGRSGRPETRTSSASVTDLD